jgi:hypothetical protein
MTTNNMTPEQIQIDELTQRVSQLEDLLYKIMKSDRMMIEKNMQMADGRNIQLGRTVGSQFGASTDQKISFLGVAPRLRYQFAQPYNAADIGTALESFGLGYH